MASFGQINYLTINPVTATCNNCKSLFIVDIFSIVEFKGRVPCEVCFVKTPLLLTNGDPETVVEATHVNELIEEDEDLEGDDEIEVDDKDEDDLPAIQNVAIGNAPAPPAPTPKKIKVRFSKQFLQKLYADAKSKYATEIPKIKRGRTIIASPGVEATISFEEFVNRYLANLPVVIAELEKRMAADGNSREFHLKSLYRRFTVDYKNGKYEIQKVN
jgi:hypothetical protein